MTFLNVKILVALVAVVGLLPLAEAHTCSTSGTVSVDAAHLIPLCYWVPPFAEGCVYTPHVCVYIPPILPPLEELLA